MTSENAMSTDGTERSNLASEILQGLDPGYHYSALAYDGDGNIIEVAWNYEHEAGDPWHNDDFTSRTDSLRRRELAVKHQEQFEDVTVETRQSKLVTDGGCPSDGAEQGVFVDGRAEYCPDCGEQLEYLNRRSAVCQGCGSDFEHWTMGDVDILYSAPEGEVITRNVDTEADRHV